MTTTFKIYVADLTEYNNGTLNGKWFDLFDYLYVDDLQGDIEEMLGDNEEWVIHDYDCDFKHNFGEYEDLEELLKIVEFLEEDEEKTLAIIEEFGIDDLDDLDNYIFYSDVKNEYDLGYYWLVESGCYEIPSHLENYIDYESFGSDHSINAQGYFSRYGWIEYRG